MIQQKKNLLWRLHQQLRGLHQQLTSSRFLLIAEYHYGSFRRYDFKRLHIYAFLQVATSQISIEHSRATTFAKLAESPTIRNGSSASFPAATDVEMPNDELGVPSVLPVSAENAGMLPKRPGMSSGY